MARITSVVACEPELPREPGIHQSAGFILFTGEERGDFCAGPWIEHGQKTQVFMRGRVPDRVRRIIGGERPQPVPMLLFGHRKNKFDWIAHPHRSIAGVSEEETELSNGSRLVLQSSTLTERQAGRDIAQVDI